MVVEAFIYMFVVGFGTALGVLLAVLIGWKVWGKVNSPKVNKQRKRGA